MAYKRTSHLSSTSIIEGYTDLYDPPFVPNFNKTEQLTLHQKYNKRPDLLAYDLYGEAAFWWVFTIYNKNQITDPINDFITGITIYVPTRNFIAGL